LRHFVAVFWRNNAQSREDFTNTVYWHLLGGLAALGSAFCWAVSAVLFQQLGEHVSALAMNLFKGIVATICIGVILLPTGLADMSRDAALLLALSGLVGICLGDTLFFLTIKRLGSRLTLLMGSLIPVATASIAVAVLGEHVGLSAGVGLLLTVIGVSYVLWERSPVKAEFVQWRMGVFFGLLFVLANALGIIFTKVGVKDIPALDATFVRTIWAVIGLAAWVIVARTISSVIEPVKNPRLRNRLLLASVIGAFVGTWLSVAALKYTHAAVAVTLNSTSPLFVLPLAMMVLKEQITWRAVSGAFVAVMGITVYFFSLYW
jgi:drug/metabolite transporter (DMT)-like permease